VILSRYSSHGILVREEVGLAAPKFAISVPEGVMRRVDQAARRRGMTRSGFIPRVLARVASARTDADISRRVDAFFADPEVRREQVATARAFRRTGAKAA
jgi:hypothetical protein